MILGSVLVQNRMPESVTPHDRPKRSPERRCCVLESYAFCCRTCSRNSAAVAVPLSTIRRCQWTTVRPYDELHFNSRSGVRISAGWLGGLVQRIDFGLGAGANPNAQIGYPTRSPKKVSRTSILRIGIVRFLVPNMFLELCCCYWTAVDYTSEIGRKDFGRLAGWRGPAH